MASYCGVCRQLWTKCNSPGCCDGHGNKPTISLNRLPPMPPAVRRLVEWAEGAEAQMESDRGPSKTHPTEGERIIDDARRIYRSEP